MPLWKIGFFVIGAILPIAVALLTIYFGTWGVRGSGRMVRATCLGLALGAVGGLLVSGIVIGLTLALREAR